MKSNEYYLGDIIELFDKYRKPVSTLDREGKEKKYPYYGANGIIDRIDDYIFDGKYILMAEDGSVLNDDKYPVLCRTNGKFWLNNHAHIFKSKENIVDQDFLFFKLMNTVIVDKVTGAVQLKLNQENLKSIKLLIPEMNYQKKIASILNMFITIKDNNDILNSNYEIIKKIYLQKLLSNDKYYDVKRLFEVTINNRKQVGNEEDFVVLSAVKTGNLEKSDEVFKKEVASKKLNKYLIVEKNDYSYNPARINIGSIGRNLYDFKCCVSPVYITFSVDNKYLDFFDLYFKSEEFKKEVNLRACGSVRQTLSYEDFSRIELKYLNDTGIETFNSFISDLQMNINDNKKMNIRLEHVFKSLLPKLMNGEIDLDNIEI